QPVVDIRRPSEGPKPQPVQGDPLSDALIFLAAHHGRALSRDALVAGLPMLDGRLPVALFDRAARRAGLEAEAIKRTIAEIPALVLPAVLVMRDGSTRVLLEAAPDPRHAKVIDPSSETRSAARPLGAEAPDYLGYAFLVRPSAAAEPRVAAAGDLPKD